MVLLLWNVNLGVLYEVYFMKNRLQFHLYRCLNLIYTENVIFIPKLAGIIIVRIITIVIVHLVEQNHFARDHVVQ